MISKIINIGKDLRYKVYKITNGRLYTDRVRDTAVIIDNQIIAIQKSVNNFLKGVESFKK